ncbi:hypothetical protein NP493_331g05065 [Ridgeia piscesae]|uniref:Uncharacterized protein n=1 Tax=Ridgeia piscesae TaxID=27915 RepID=A0AAD9NU57_RIDPI|nr:hypothetical protein NP493_331g05065 [Ridgeia piscesae]
MCAVVNRVVLHRQDHRRAKSVGDNITHSHIRRRRRDRRSTRIETRHRQNPLLFSTFATATANAECGVTSQSQRTNQFLRRQLHAFTHPPAPPRSPFNSHRNATSPKRYKGNRPNSAQRDCFFQIPEHPMLPQQQPVSSNSASYVLSVSCLFLCGPLRRISVNARFYVQCCLVL